MTTITPSMAYDFLSSELEKIESFLEEEASTLSIELLGSAKQLLESALANEMPLANTGVYREECESTRLLLRNLLRDRDSMLADSSLLYYLPDLVTAIISTAPETRRDYADLIAVEIFADLTELHCDDKMRQHIPLLDMCVDRMRDVLVMRPITHDVEMPAKPTLKDISSGLVSRWSLAQQNIVPERVVVQMAEYDSDLRKPRDNVAEQVTVEDYMLARIAMRLNHGDLIVQARALLEDCKRQYRQLEWREAARFLEESMPEVVKLMLSRTPDGSLLSMRDAIYDFAYYADVNGEPFRQWLSEYIDEQYAARGHYLAGHAALPKTPVPSNELDVEAAALPTAEVFVLNELAAKYTRNFREAATPIDAEDVLVSSAVLESNRASRNVETLSNKGDIGREAHGILQRIQQRLREDGDGLNEAFLRSIPHTIAQILPAVKDGSFFSQCFSHAGIILRRLEELSQRADYLAVCPQLQAITYRVEYDMLVAADGEKDALDKMARRFIEPLGPQHLPADPGNLETMFNVLETQPRQWVYYFVRFATLIEESATYQDVPHIDDLRETLRSIARDTPRNIEDINAKREIMEYAQNAIEDGKYERAYQYGRLAIALSFVNDEPQTFYWKGFDDERRAVFYGALGMHNGHDDILIVRDARGQAMQFVLDGKLMMENDAFEFAENFIDERERASLRKALPELTGDFMEHLKVEDRANKRGPFSFLFPN